MPLGRLLCAVSIVVLAGPTVARPGPVRLLHLAQTAGVSGHEADVRAAVRAQLPAWAHAEEDSLGSLLVTVGGALPHTLVVASLDEGGYVVSDVTDDGFLRLYRHAGRGVNPLQDQYDQGQPVVVHTSTGARVAGVTAVPSAHLGWLTDLAEIHRIKGLADLWVDVGARSREEVAAAGIRILDPVVLRDHARALAGGKVAGVWTQSRGGAQALVEFLRAQPVAPRVNGTLTVAWAAQSHFAGRGLARLARAVDAGRVVVVGSSLPPPGSDEMSAGALGAGPLVAEDDQALIAAAEACRVPHQRVPAARLTTPATSHWQAGQVHVVSLPALYPQTPVETIDADDVGSLARLVSAVVGLPCVSPPGASDASESADSSKPAPDAPPANGLVAMLETLVELPGVSGHEAPVREAIRARLPAWTAPAVDERGNLTVSFGNGDRELLFVAHMDEIGFEIDRVQEDGSAALRQRGLMYLSQYEAHPMVLQTDRGPRDVIVRPRADYLHAKTALPDPGPLVAWFGTRSRDETLALGVREGQPLSVPKSFMRLGAARAATRSMDDRAGAAALLAALTRIDPDRVRHRVTFAWSVEEEVGLHGAAALAERFHPEVAFAIDTFVSTDAPLDLRFLARAQLGRGPVLRGLDSRTIVPSDLVDRVRTLARDARIPLQLGVTPGGTDASAFSAHGSRDVVLSWPGRYSHSPVELLDLTDLEALSALIVWLVEHY